MSALPVAVVPALADAFGGLREGVVMFWQTLWALVLGFLLSGVVQAFVSKDRMRAALGDHRPASVARASLFGMASSSCSYAASAMARSLVAKGADFTTAMVFQVASTNLVVELGIVLVVLLGWQFAVAEFVGGPIMIVLLALAGGAVFAPALLASVRRRRGQADDRSRPSESDDGPERRQGGPVGTSARSLAAWSDASRYAVADATMLRRELFVGYAVAGLLAVLVPARAWDALFLHGHGVWTTVENAFVGPLIAVASWVCSIGNVPLAAALWSGGISFGGVVAFLFADLIAMPLILVYRKFYGWRLTVRLVGLLYGSMVVAGLVTQGIFRGFGALPVQRTWVERRIASRGAGRRGWTWPSSVWPSSRGGWPATPPVSEGAPVTRWIRCAACRCGRPTLRPAPSTTAPPCTSVPITVVSATRPDGATRWAPR